MVRSTRPDGPLFKQGTHQASSVLDKDSHLRARPDGPPYKEDLQLGLVRKLLSEISVHYAKAGMFTPPFKTCLLVQGTVTRQTSAV